MSATVAGTPVLRVAGPLAAALAPDALAALDGAPLAAWLAGRRWYGAKGDRAAAARVVDAIPVRAPGLVAALACVEVVLPAGRIERYQLPLTVRDGGSASALARVEAGDARGALVDATEEPAFRDWLHDAFARGRTVAGGAMTFVAEPARGAPPTSESTSRTGSARHRSDADADVPPRPASRLVASEQSNSSVVYGDREILKLFRRLEAGESPEVEVARFLATRTRFRHTPALRGTARYEGAVEGAAGMLQDFVPGAVDAFTVALEASRRAAAGEPGGFAVDAARLGVITRELHDALASDPADPDFAPWPAGDADLRRWVAGVRRTADDGLDLLARRAQGGALDPGLARAVTARRDHVARHLALLVGEVGDDGGQLVRHHGDYHLGQVLRAPDGGLFVIDFEGEPARPLAERRARHSALRDVAGMLRSFAYAAAIGAADAGVERRSALAARSSRWERDVRLAFLNGYFGGPDAAPGAAFLPRRREHADALVALFEVEKAFYELAYELNNRPGWAWVPLTGIARLTERWERDG